MLHIAMGHLESVQADLPSFTLSHTCFATMSLKTISLVRHVARCAALCVIEDRISDDRARFEATKKLSDALAAKGRWNGRTCCFTQVWPASFGLRRVFLGVGSRSLMRFSVECRLDSWTT